MKSKTLLILASLFIVLGLYRSNLISIPFVNSPAVCCDIDITEPDNEELKILASAITASLVNGSEDRSVDGYRLASLYNDMATLIAIDGDVIQNTATIREANILAAKLLKIDLKGKYPGLSEACDILVKKTVTEDAVNLDVELRQKAVNAFKALAWGCAEGAK